MKNRMPSMLRLGAIVLVVAATAGCAEDDDARTDGDAVSDTDDTVSDAGGDTDADADGDADADADGDTDADVGGDADADGDGDADADVTDPGTPVGSMWNTYYYFASEADYAGADDTALYDESCDEIAMVPAEYSDDVCIEGSGRLEDGRVINYASSCSCGRPCPTGGIICYAVLDPAAFPWGMGSRGNALVPLRSWAVDNAFLPYGTVLYAEEWDGVAIPALDGLGGFTHDGCFRADDVGGAIDGNHFDFFAGTAGMWGALEDIHPTGSDFTVYRDGDRCAYLLP
ncbi:MAG: hypothetical protein HY907_19960 [Deltaproteobacteria bacterium]|nr:hypothetical protein [Deltaproteobacteria bacterium]